MINRLALHKLQKLRSSKMLLVFVIGCGFLALVTVIPPVVFAAYQGVSIGSEIAAGFFELLVGIGQIAALFLGVTTWRPDYKDGTLLTFAARPIARVELLVGKILGSIYALLIFLAISLLIYLLLHLIFLRFAIPAVSLLYLLQVFLSWMATFSIGLFFSSFSGTLMASVLGALYFLISMIGRQLANLPESTLTFIGKAVRMISIDRDLGYSLAQVLSSDLGSLAPLWKASGYYVLWTLLLICASILLFARREFMGKRS